MAVASNQNNTHSIDKAFAKYDKAGKGFLDKTEFKCAFIFLMGMKPSRKDMDLVNEFVGRPATSAAFQIGLHQFRSLMQTYLQQLQGEASAAVDEPQAELKQV